MTFQKNVIYVAIIVFILAMIVFGIYIHNSKYSFKYPPVIGTCPDYWTDINGYCVNTKKIGKDSCQSSKIDFSQGQWIGDTGTCLKQKWAKACDITWDGITNNSTSCDKSI
jgi:hypothetical protein